MASYTDIANTLSFAVSFKPSSAFPIDARTMFGSKAAAEAAAATAVNAGSSESIYYFGMPLTVFDNDEATMYVINGDGTLKEVGKATYGDNKSIVMNSDTGALSLKSFGEEYFAYHAADHVLEGSYTYPDGMPVTAIPGDFVQVDSVWYMYNGNAWVTGSTPKSSPYYELVSGWKEGLEPKVTGNPVSGYSLAWYEPSTTTVEGLSSAIGSLQSSFTQLGQEVTAMNNKVDSNTTAIEILNSDSSVEGSIAKQVADGIATVVAESPEKFDNLKKISDWISTHTDDAADMNSNIAANTTAIKALETLVGPLPEDAQATTVIGYIAEAINKMAVTSVTAGANGHILVNGNDVKVYEAPTASTEQAGVMKVDGTSIEVIDGTASVKAVDVSKVTNIENTYLAKDDVVASADLSVDLVTASDLKAASEKALIESLTWKTTM